MNWPVCLLMALLAAVAPVASPADVGFATSYRAPNAVPVWRSGAIGLAPNGTGYVIHAFGPAPTNESAQASVSLTKLDRSGAVDWAVWTTEGQMGFTTLKPHPASPLVFAKIEGLAQEQFWTVFGWFNARDGSALFQRGIHVTVQTNAPGSYIPEPRPSVADLSDGRVAVLLSGSQPLFSMALLDERGQPQWQRSFGAPSFLGGGPYLIEDPGHGFWVVVPGRQRISTAPNPPSINTAVTLNVVRFNLAGEVVWSKKVTGLQTSSLSSGLLPTVGVDGTLVFTLTDTILGNPIPTGFAAYIVALSPDGDLRWGRRIGGVAGTGLTPQFAPDQSAIFLSGAKLKSLTALSVDGLVVKLDAKSGDPLGQIAIHPNTLTDLTIADVAQNRVFVHAWTYSLTTPASAWADYIGSADLDLQNSTWKQSSLHGSDSAGLVYDPSNGSLLFADFPTTDSRIDAIQLDTDLNPLATGVLAENPSAACQFFTPANLTILSPNMKVDPLNLTASNLDLTVADTSIPMEPTTRIQLRPFTPVAEDLCHSAQTASPQLLYRADATHAGFSLMFMSQTGASYQILVTPALGQPFQSLETVTGDGNLITRTFNAAKDRNAFYTVKSLPR